MGLVVVSGRFKEVSGRCGNSGEIMGCVGRSVAEVTRSILYKRKSVVSVGRKMAGVGS